MSTDRLAAIHRLVDGEHAELRVERAEYNGHRFTRLCLWLQGGDGQYYPTRRSVTLRDRDLPLVLAALIESRRLADVEQGLARPEERRGQRVGPRDEDT